MQAVVLDDISTTLPENDLFERLRVRRDSTRGTELLDLIRKAESVGRPRAYFGEASIEERGDDYVVVEGIRFSSRVLVVNTEKTQRVFPFVVTCGTELESWANGLDGLLYRFWSEEIRIAAMRNALAAVEAYLASTYHLDKSSRMAPGEFDDWPIQEQLPLFQLLSDTEKAVGVRLTESMMMLPTKSASGMFFAAAHSFEACMLCTQATCPNRRAPYDPELYDRRYRKQPSQA
jgi:hypothetical protein